MTDTPTHYGWGHGCEGWRLCDQPELSVIEELMPPDTAERPHLHQRATQYFHILSGVACVRLPGEDTVIVAGQGVVIRPGVTHQMRNDAAVPLRFLLVSAPSTTGDRIEQEL